MGGARGVLVAFTVTAGLALPQPALSQAAVIGFVAAGPANLKVPSATMGVDRVGARGITAGASVSGVIWHEGIFGGAQPWSMFLASGRAGFHSVGLTSSRLQRYVIGEMTVTRGLSCCGGSLGGGVSVGVNRWMSEKRALRLEGRLFIPRNESVALLFVHVGFAFR